MHISCLAFCLILLGPLCQGATLNALSTDCLCDVTSLCDDQCCCDTACAAPVVSRWAALNLCADDTLPIPSCTSLTAQQPQKQDLYSGLLTIYKVIKQLFCIQQINFINPTLSYSTSASTLAPFTLSSPQSFINTAVLSLASFFTALPVRNGMGGCQSSTILYTMNAMHDQHCMAAINSGLLLISTYTTLAPLIRIFSMDTPSSPTATTITPTPTDCSTGTVCNNAVRYVQIYFKSNSQIDTTTSFILVGSTPKGSYFPIRYSYQFTTIGRSSQQGYLMGSYLQLAYSTAGGNYYRMSNPLNLAFRTPSGTCTDAAGSDVSSLISLKFGVNAIYSCVGLSSSIYANLLGAVNLVGIYGAATTNLLDYISVTPFSGQSSKQSSVQLVISYKSIGSASDNQFQIVQVQVNQVSRKNNEMALYVEYNRVPTNPSVVVPSPPIVDAYLPNDFLYPFYVA